jgi:hypothetical protein
MADIRIKDLGTTASVTASDDFMAVDGTTNGTRKLSAATPSFATSVTVPGVSAPASTALTLAGGTSGASLVLGQGVSAIGSISTGNDYSFTSVRTSGVNNAIARGLMVRHTTTLDMIDGLGSALTFAVQDNAGVSNPIADVGAVRVGADNTGGVIFRNYTAGTPAEVGRFSPTNGNLLIGTTTDITGTGGLHVAGTGTASTATSGALRVGSNVGLSGNAGGASYFGGNLNVAGGSIVNGTSTSVYYLGTPSNNYIYYDGSSLFTRLGGTDRLTITASTGAATFAGIIKPQQATTAGAPAYVKGAIYFDTTLNKLRVGGATAWETITSV